jgi:hypothetical protein
MTTHRFLKVIPAAALALALAAPAFAEDGSSVQVGFGYDGWRSTPRSSAAQAYVPVRVATKRGDLSLALLGGLAHTNFNSGSGENVSSSNPLDTKFVSSFAVVDKLPVDVLLGLDVNLPTGEIDLAAKELPLVMDSELVTVNSFGEGWNFNPSLTVAKEIGDWVVGASTAYAFRGRYAASSQSALRDFDPGNVWTASAAVQGDLSREVELRIFGSFASYGTEREGNMPLLREGNFYMAGCEAAWHRDRSRLALTLKGIYRDKNSLPDAEGVLAKETSNSHGMEYRGELSGAIALSGKTVLSASLAGLHAAANDYAQGSGRYVGKRTKGTVGLGVAQRLTDAIEGDLSVKGFVMKDQAMEIPVPAGDRTYRGLQSVARVTARF